MRTCLLIFIKVKSKHTSRLNNVCEKEVFAAIFKREAPQLHAFLYHKFGGQTNPEDLVQEAFLKLWKQCKKVRLEKAKSFLFTIANNLSLNQVKHQKVVYAHSQTPQKHTTNQSPEYVLEEKEFLNTFKKALAKLPEGQRMAFMLNRAEGKTHQEIADMLGISRKAVEKRIYKALARLRKDIDVL